jgi:hypothetical protein
MTLHISEDFAACLVNWSIVAVILNTMPPRDPNDTTMTRTKKMKRTSTETTSRRSFANQMMTSDEAAN